MVGADAAFVERWRLGHCSPRQKLCSRELVEVVLGGAELSTYFGAVGVVSPLVEEPEM